MRQKQSRDHQLLLGLSTIQSGQHNELHQGVTGIGYSHPSGHSIIKTQPNKVSIPSQSMNFPSFDNEEQVSAGRPSQTLSSLINLHNSGNMTLQVNQKSMQHQNSGGLGQVSPTSGVSPKGIHPTQQLAPSASSYQFPLQALGQGLTSNLNPSKE